MTDDVQLDRIPQKCWQLSPPSGGDVLPAPGRHSRKLCINEAATACENITPSVARRNNATSTTDLWLPDDDACRRLASWLSVLTSGKLCSVDGPVLPWQQSPCQEHNTHRVE